MNVKRWLPIALCCLPGVVVAATVVAGIAVGGATISGALDGPLGLGLIALAVLACPVSMGLMIVRQRGSLNSSSENTSLMADCCAPGDIAAFDQTSSPAARLAELRQRREALERELVDVQTQ